MGWMYSTRFRSLYYRQVNYNVISKPNVTYQKANEIVKQFIFEDPNRINTLKYKTEERFHWFILFIRCCAAKFTTEQIILEFKIKTILIFIFKFGKIEKLEVRSVQKYWNNYHQLITAKDQKNYENRELQKNEQMLINIKMNENELVRPMMVSVSCSTDENAT